MPCKLPPRMNSTEVLVLNGSPGSGKTTLANAIAERLRELSVFHAVIDLDELARVGPEPDGSPEFDISLKWRNLCAMWPNYSALLNLKVIIPVCIDSQRDLEELHKAAPARKLTICELVAGELVLKERVTTREPNEYWRSRLRSLVDRHLGKDPTDKVGDFRVRTDDKSIDEAVQQILNHLGWQSVEPRGSGRGPEGYQNVELTMERLTLDNLPLCVNDEFCAVREYQPGDEVSWTRIQAAADRHNTITSTLFTREFGHDSREHTRRILFAVTPGQELVGVSAAWWGSSSTDQWGRVHWVAVLPAWQRQGIGRKLLVATCHRLRQLGHKKAFLTTSPVRVEALRLYWSLGFMPRITASTDREVWREVASRLGDPTLAAWLSAANPDKECGF